MIRNGYTNTYTPKEVTEYKIGHTTYEVVTRFNLSGESLKDILARLIRKEIQKSA
ncbi:MAG: transposon-encoded TnpW family protein [Eubacterium sp.]|nr:transposon-encoded TnpW family protein [Eubacterium sp.]